MFFNNQIKNEHGDTKKIWKSINDAVYSNMPKNQKINSVYNSEGILVNDKFTVAEVFNDFFGNVGDNISS